jgi:RNA polymerase sigma factor (sigma-70 family)
MDNLSKIAQHHEEYIRYIKKMGTTSHAEDLVQEMYLRLFQYDCIDKAILEDGTVNKSYIWRTLRNLLSSYATSANKFHFVQIDKSVQSTTSYEDENKGQIIYKEYAYEQPDNEREEAYSRLFAKLEVELSKLDEPNKYNYNQVLFMTYLKDKESLNNRKGYGLTIRKMSEITKISETSIFNTIKNCRKALAEELEEDITDFNNQDYELI